MVRSRHRPLNTKWRRRRRRKKPLTNDACARRIMTHQRRTIKVAGRCHRGSFQNIKSRPTHHPKIFRFILMSLLVLLFYFLLLYFVVVLYIILYLVRSWKIFILTMVLFSDPNVSYKFDVLLLSTLGCRSAILEDEEGSGRGIYRGNSLVPCPDLYHPI